MVRIILGLLGAGVGFLLVWKSNWFNDNFGSISSWADEHLGGTRAVYKLLGVLIIFIGFLAATNLHVSFFRALFGGLFGLPEEPAI